MDKCDLGLGKQHPHIVEAQNKQAHHLLVFERLPDDDRDARLVKVGRHKINHLWLSFKSTKIQNILHESTFFQNIKQKRVKKQKIVSPPPAHLSQSLPPQQYQPGGLQLFSMIFKHRLMTKSFKRDSIGLHTISNIIRWNHTFKTLEKDVWILSC